MAKKLRRILWISRVAYILSGGDNLFVARYKNTPDGWTVYTNEFLTTGIKCESEAHARQVIEGLFALES